MSKVKCVLITGSTSGIGLALYRKYQTQGYQVVACGRSEKKLMQYNPQAHLALCFDVNNPDEIKQASEQLGDLDILILNAGTCEYIDNVKSFDGDLYRHVVNTNLVSMGALLQYFLPKIVSSGKLALIRSCVSLLTLPRAQAYGASKAGIDYLAKSLSLELSQYGLLVSLIHPGFVKTLLTDRNKFFMPFILSSENAAERIYQGIKKGKRYVSFPKRLIVLLKLLSCLPQNIWRGLIIKGI